MREILFRGKKVDNGEWIYGWYAQAVYGRWPLVDSICPAEEAEAGHLQFFEVYSDTISQYTGLIDGNGKKIFDGDILQFGVHRLIVYWDEENYQWAAKKTKGYDVIHFMPEHLYEYWSSIDLGEIAAEEIITGRMTTVVIGNIFDNPDLIADSESNTDWSGNEFKF